MAFERADIAHIALTDFSGGLNSNPLSEQVKPNQFVDCENVYWNQGLRSVFGITKLHYGLGASVPINGICDFQERDGTRHIVIVGADALYNEASGGWTDITGTSGLTSTTALHQFIVFNDRLVGTNYDDYPYQWTGVGGASRLSTEDLKGRWICTYNGRACLGDCKVGANIYPHRVYFSELDDPTTWDTTDNYWELETDDAQVINGIKQLGQTLVVYKTRSIGIISGFGLESWAVDRQFKTGIGCVAGSSVKTAYLLMGGALTEVHIFMSNQGLAAFDGTNVYLLPMPAENEQYINYEYWGGLNQSRLHYACSGFYRPQGLSYCFYSSSGSSTNDAGCIYEAGGNGMWPLQNINARVATEVYDSVNSRDTLFIGTDDGEIYYLDEDSEGIPYGTDLVTDGDMEAVGVASWPVLGGTRVKNIVDYANGVQGLTTDVAGTGGGVYQDLTTVAGKRYTVTCVNKILTGADLTGASQLEVKDGTTSLGSYYLGTGSSTDWQQLKVEFTALSTTTRIELTDRRGAGGTMVWDDVSCKESGISAYAKSLWMHFDSEQDAKILREMVPFCTVAGDYNISLAVAYDRGRNTIDSDTYSLVPEGTTIWGYGVWGTGVWGADFLEVSSSLSNLDKYAFFSMQYMISNIGVYRPFTMNKLHINVMPIGKRWR